MTKTIENAFILILTGAICVVANMMGYKGGLYDSVLGMAVIVVIGIIGFGVSQLPYCNKIYGVVWVSVFAILASSSIFPGHEWIVQVTGKVQFMAIATAILAYAGLSIGKDLPMFKKISWRIIPVALAVCAGTFLFAAIIAQFALRWEGAI